MSPRQQVPSNFGNGTHIPIIGQQKTMMDIVKIPTVFPCNLQIPLEIDPRSGLVLKAVQYISEGMSELKYAAIHLYAAELIRRKSTIEPLGITEVVKFAQQIIDECDKREKAQQLNQANQPEQTASNEQLSS